MVNSPILLILSLITVVLKIKQTDNVNSDPVHRTEFIYSMLSFTVWTQKVAGLAILLRMSFLPSKRLFDWSDIPDFFFTSVLKCRLFLDFFPCSL